MKINKFPKDFLWGASTSAFQVEGAAYSYGKGITTADIRTAKKREFQMDTSISVDYYHNFEDDILLMKELGMKSYRFSISWARIFPNGNDKIPNKIGVEFYHNILNLLKKYEIEPIVTMFHFDYPMALIEQYGGWISKKSIDDFVTYADFLFEEYGSKVKYWLTINEQSVMIAFPDMIGIDLNNDKKDVIKLAQQANYNMFIAQAKVYKLCHNKLPNAKIGPAISYLTSLPATMKSKDLFIAKQLDDYHSFALMDIAIRGKFPKYYKNMIEKCRISINQTEEDIQILKEGIADFIGINWYCTTIVSKKDETEENIPIFNQINIIKDNDLIYTDWDWNFDPIGIRYALQKINDRYPDVPVIVTECGWSQREKLEDGKIHDNMRIKYLKEHIYQIYLAIEDGVNVISFNPWSFIDILSSSDGMEKRYGLVYVDRDDFNEKSLKRYKKDSFFYYKKVIETNGDFVINNFS